MKPKNIKYEPLIIFGLTLVLVILYQRSDSPLSLQEMNIMELGPYGIIPATLARQVSRQPQAFPEALTHQHLQQVPPYRSHLAG